MGGNAVVAFPMSCLEFFTPVNRVRKGRVPSPLGRVRLAFVLRSLQDYWLEMSESPFETLTGSIALLSVGETCVR